MQLNPYLMFNGDCEAAFRFYETLFGGHIDALMPHEGSPAAEHVPAEWRTKVLHAHMTIGNQVLMASDAPPGHYQRPQGYSVTVNVDSAGDAERIFKALAEGGTVQMEFGETFWAERFGMVVDRFGTPWMVNCQGRKQP